MSKALKNKVKLNDVVSVKDFGAVGDGVTDDTTAIQSAINAAAATGTIVIFFSGTFVITSGINQPANTVVDLGNAIINASAVSTGAAWNISAGGEIRRIREVLIGGIFKGVASPAAGVYSATTDGIKFQTSQIAVQGVCVQGFKNAFEFDSNSYVIRLENSSAWYNKRGMNCDQQDKSNMGADLIADKCLFAHNDFGVYNRLCEVKLVQCAIDSMQVGVVEENITASGGSNNGQMLFEGCRFENGGSISFPWFKNSGYMVLRDPMFFEPATFSYLFDNSGVIDIEGGLSRLQSANYTSRNTGLGTISVYGLRPQDFNGECARLSVSESGIYNSNFELGTTAGWVVTTGSAANMTANADAHLGAYSLQFVSGGTSFAAESWPIPIRTGTKQALLNVYCKNLNATAVYPTLKFYTSSGIEISTQFEIIPANTTTWTRVRFTGFVPSSTAYAKLTLTLGIAETSAVRFDNLYINMA